jgi:hypothetical protein
MARTLPRLDPAGLLGFVSEAHLTKIGRVIVQWSMLEAIIEAAIWQAAGLRNDMGRAMTSQTQMLSKLDLLEAVLMQTRPKLGEQFSAVANYVRDCLAGRRNLVAHGMWTETPKGNLLDSSETALGVVKFSARGRLTSHGREVDPRELDSLALEMAEVTAWVIDLCALLPALKQRRGGLGHKIPETQIRPRCATLRGLVLQPPVGRPKAPPKPPAKAQQNQRRVRAQKMAS